MGRPVSDKRDRLVQAAMACFHEVGCARTTIAQVADRAGVPSGAVFYYFRTKDDLIRAVAEEWRRVGCNFLQPLDQLASPWDRLTEFLRQGRERADFYATQGCPLAALARDLRHEGPKFSDCAAGVYAAQLNWVDEQFAQAGFADATASAHARSFTARFHGALHLSYAQSEPQYLVAEADSLMAWLVALQSSCLADP